MRKRTRMLVKKILFDHFTTDFLKQLSLRGVEMESSHLLAYAAVTAVRVASACHVERPA